MWNNASMIENNGASTSSESTSRAPMQSAILPVHFHANVPLWPSQFLPPQSTIFPTGYNMKPVSQAEYFAKIFIWDINDLTMLSRHQLKKASEQCPVIASHTNLLVDLFFGLLVKLEFYSKCGSKYFRLDNINEERIIHKFPTPEENYTASCLFKRDTHKYGNLRIFYDKISKNLKGDGLISEELIEITDYNFRKKEIYQAAEKYQEYFHLSWKNINRCLRLVNEKSRQSNKKYYTNVVICGDELGYGAAQLLIAGYAPEVPIDNIYSLIHTSIEPIFKKIKQKFGEQCDLVFITSDKQYTSVAETMNIPVWSVEDYDAFDKLYTAQTAFSL